MTFIIVDNDPRNFKSVEKCSRSNKKFIGLTIRQCNGIYMYIKQCIKKIRLSKCEGIKS